jgi:hypothetical protein
MAETHKVSVKNTSGGRRILNGLNGPVLLHAGETTDSVEISDAELKIARDVGYFEFDGKSAGGEAQEPGPLDGSVEDLTAHIATIEDADEIQRLIDAETSGKSRKSALAALEARKEELTAE